VRTTSIIVNSRNSGFSGISAIQAINEATQSVSTKNNPHTRISNINNINTTLFRTEIANHDDVCLESTNIYTPSNIKARNICCGEDFTLCVTKDYQLLVCGNNLNYQIGVKENSNIFYPFNYSNYLKQTYPDLKDTKIKEAHSTGNNVLFLTKAGGLYLCSNFNAKNKKCFPLISYDLGFQTKVETFECGKGFTIILSTAGVVFSMGDNMYGQLGLGDTENRKNPTEIKSLKDFGAKVLQIGCGYKHAAVKTSTGKVFSWGNNSYGQLGDNSYDHSSTPIPVLSQFNFIQVSTGRNSTYILAEDKSIFFSGSSSKQPFFINKDYSTKLPHLFTYNNYEIFKICHTWNTYMSVFYAIVAETTLLKLKLKSKLKTQNIFSMISKNWNSKDIYPNFPEGIKNYISEKHLDVKEGYRKTALVKDNKFD